MFEPPQVIFESSLPTRLVEFGLSLDKAFVHRRHACPHIRAIDEVAAVNVGSLEESVLWRVKRQFQSHVLRALPRSFGRSLSASAPVLSLFLAGCVTGNMAGCCDYRYGGELGSSEAQPVSIISLIAISPELAGSLVRVEGYLAADWEGPVVFFSSESCKTYSSFDGVSLIPAEGVVIDFGAYSDPDCRRVAVTGVYDFWRVADAPSELISMRVSNAFLREVKQVEDVSSFD